MARKYQAPAFLDGLHDQAVYERWLHRKAMAHVRRDRKRGNKIATNAEYKLAIHQAVIESGGRDAYTGEELDWSLISTYDNEKSKQGRRAYKKKFELLPSVDHVDDGLGPASFKICSWRTNDCKNDLSLDELLRFCRMVLNHASGDSAMKTKQITIRTKRVYDAPEATDGRRILVDRLWPRGLSKEKAKVDVWAKGVSPSTELRRWYGHDPDKWAEFKKRYAAELDANPEQMAELLEEVRKGKVTFLYSSKETDLNNARALKEYIEAIEP